MNDEVTEVETQNKNGVIPPPQPKIGFRTLVLKSIFNFGRRDRTQDQGSIRGAKKKKRPELVKGIYFSCDDVTEVKTQSKNGVIPPPTLELRRTGRPSLSF